MGCRLFADTCAFEIFFRCTLYGQVRPTALEYLIYLILKFMICNMLLAQTPEIIDTCHEWWFTTNIRN